MKIVVAFSLIIQCGYCFSQSKSLIVKTSDLPNRDSFNQLNYKEQKWAKSSQDHLNDELFRIKINKDSIDFHHLPDSLIYLDHMYPTYTENRSRFATKEYQNGELNDSLRVIAMSKAICIRSSDSTLSILTGTGIFGGIYFRIELKNDTFYSELSLDNYRDSIFKQNATDPHLLSKIEIRNVKESLQLDAGPNYSKVDFLNGHLEFSTTTVYRTVDYDPYIGRERYDAEHLNELYYTGELDFTCKVIREFPESRHKQKSE